MKQQWCQWCPWLYIMFWWLRSVGACFLEESCYGRGLSLGDLSRICSTAQPPTSSAPTNCWPIIGWKKKHQDENQNLQKRDTNCLRFTWAPAFNNSSRNSCSSCHWCGVAFVGRVTVSRLVPYKKIPDRQSARWNVLRIWPSTES